MKATLTQVVPHPAAPSTIGECGLSLDLLQQIALKTLNFAGDVVASDLAARMGLRFPVIEPALDLLRQRQDCEVAGGGSLGAPSYRYRITDAGRTRVALFLEQNHYVGVAPVPLAQYRDYMHRFALAVPRSATRERVKEAFSKLVLSNRVIDHLGPALNSGHSLFVYGPPGNGKTAIAQSIRNLLHGEIAVPHAVSIEGNIVRLFDPVIHEPLPPIEGLLGLDEGTAADGRWVRCRRPLVTVGGELTMGSLELSFEELSGFYRAPIQMVANGGVLVVDDFGRQRCEPVELLNRWIVPLESRVDYLTLKTGQKIDIPFAVLMVFATNLRPADLVDEAFLRRIRYKVLAESPTAADFHTIFRNCCTERGLEFDPDMVDRLLRDYYRPRKLPLRGCHPRDLIDQALSLADYNGDPRRLTTSLLESACATYFVDDQETVDAPA